MSQAAAETDDHVRVEWPMGSVGDDEARELARRIEREHPRWIVMFGAFTKQFICFPRFQAEPGTIVVAFYPGTLPARMKDAERVCHLRKQEV